MEHLKPRSSLMWLREVLEAPVSESDARMPRSDGSLFDTEQVQDCCGSADKGRAVLQAVVTRGPGMLDDLSAHHQGQEIESVLNQVHDLRGLAQILGAYATAQLCLRIELHYESASPETKDELIDRFLQQATPLLDAIRLYLDAWTS